MCNLNNLFVWHTIRQYIFALYQPLHPEFIVNSFDIKRAAAIFAQFTHTLHGKHKANARNNSAYKLESFNWD